MRLIIPNNAIPSAITKGENAAAILNSCGIGSAKIREILNRKNEPITSQNQLLLLRYHFMFKTTPMVPNRKQSSKDLSMETKNDETINVPNVKIISEIYIPLYFARNIEINFMLSSMSTGVVYIYGFSNIINSRSSQCD